MIITAIITTLTCDMYIILVPNIANQVFFFGGGVVTSSLAPSYSHLFARLLVELGHQLVEL